MGEPTLPAGRAASLLRALAVLCGFELLLVAAYGASGLWPAHDPRVAYAVGFLAVSASSVASAWASPLLQPRDLVWLAVPCVLLWVVASLGGAGLLAAVAVTAALLIGGTLLGAVVGGLIEHPGQLLFVAIVSGAADLASVLHPTGPSATLAHTPAALALLALPWPMLGTAALEPFLGVGDVVFVALYMAASRRHGLSLARTALAEGLAFAATLVIVIAFQRAVPVLPLLGCAVVAAQPRARNPSERDRKRGYAIAALVVALVAWLLLR